MKNRILSITRSIIPYVKDLRQVREVKSASTAILMQQLDYWFEKSEGNSFFKFLQPCENSLYKQGDSWCEELGFSPDEFRTAFANIGVKYVSKKEYETTINEGKNPFDGKFYLAYTDKIKGLTFYQRNHNLVDDILSKLVDGTLKEYYNPQSTEVAVPNLRKLAKPIYVNGDSQSTEIAVPNPDITDIITDTTTEITTDMGGKTPAEEIKCEAVVVEIDKEQEDENKVKSELKKLLFSSSMQKDCFLMEMKTSINKATEGRIKMEDVTMEDVEILSVKVINDCFVKLMKSEFLDNAEKVFLHIRNQKSRVGILIRGMMQNYCSSQKSRLVNNFQNTVTNTPPLSVKAELVDRSDINSADYSPYFDPNSEFYISDPTRREQAFIIANKQANIWFHNRQ